MPDHQRIHVVCTDIDEAELARLRADVGREPAVLTAPTAEAKRVVTALGADPRVEVLLAPVSYPTTDRGHRLDELVRRHALDDRFREVVVVTDPASATLLLRVLAPDQLASGGAVTVVGLARGERPVAVRRGVGLGLALGVIAYLLAPPLPLFALPAALGAGGLGLFVVPRWRHLGRELLLAAGIAVLVVCAVVAGSARFPDGW